MDASQQDEKTAAITRKGSGGALRLGIVGGVFVLAVGALEVLLQLFPARIPAAFRDGFPLHGIEFFQPGVLTECPLEGFPLPLVRVPWDGPPPADLKEYGIAPLEVDRDARRFPRVVMPADERGLPNALALEQADVVVLGDSFVVSASSAQPAGLVRGLAAALECSVYSLGVAGIGPQHEDWLLKHVGLGLGPRLVLWCFFGGNDLSDAKIVLERRRAGLRVRADLPTHRALPALYLPSLLAWSFSSAGSLEREAPADETLPPFRLPDPPDSGSPGSPGSPGSHWGETWLHPAYLVRCSIARSDWERHVAWKTTTELLLAARDRTERNGAKFVLVYLPSKAEALLPALQSAPDLLHRYLSHDLGEELPLEPPAARDLLLRNRGGLRGALAAFCDGAGIPFFSATEVLERQALAGESGFLATDTHWAPEGGEVVLAALLAFLRRNDLTPR